ncbi:hypothetical protein BG006_002455 [Podila minutissima]|uniref:Uncharacterized protein n=1 Tax=Podila minutissima TaxID=64525 RepID=A0A9P5S9T9_9FUNG|nr:hypothetical protein BG006_002455 [Podila minutissima]
MAGVPRKRKHSTEEFGKLMKELVTLHNTHVVVENEGHQDNSSASDMHQRALLLHVQGMGLENENLAANTKEHYTTYLKLFQDFCNKTYEFEEDLWYEVYEDKVLVFFKDVMFTRTIPKVFKPGDTKDIRMTLALVLLESRVSHRPIDLCQMLQQVKLEKDQSKILFGLCEGATMDQALKTLVHLQNQQSNHIINPNKASPL